MVYFPHFEGKCVDSRLGGHPVGESSGRWACYCHRTLLSSRLPGQGGLPANKEWYFSLSLGKQLPRTTILGMGVTSTLLFKAPLWLKMINLPSQRMLYKPQCPSRWERQCDRLPGNHLIENFRWNGCERSLAQSLSSFPIPNHEMDEQKEALINKWLSLISGVVSDNWAWQSGLLTSNLVVCLLPGLLLISNSACS